MRIVIVEDHPITLNVLTLALQATPEYQVLPFSTAREGLAACAQGADIAIFDNQLPDMTGTAAVTYLRAQPATRHLPVIVITGDDDRQTRMAAISAGATDFLGKPVQIDELRIRVRNLLALHAAEKEARAGQALLETLIAGANAQVAVADAKQPDAPILYASEPVQKRMHDAANRLQGLPLSALWAKAPPSAEREALEHAVDACTAGEFILSDPLGEGDGWVEISLAPVAETSGRVRYLVASITDVTALIQTRQAHARLSSRLRDIAQLSGAWFFELDDSLRLSYVSPALAQVLAVDPEAAIGRPVSMMPIRLKAPERHGMSAEHLFAPPHHPVEQEMVALQMPDGQIRAVQINASPFHDERMRFAGYRGHANDVSDIIRARDQAAQASRAKSVFLSTMSHEMRTPLTAIIGLSELAASDIPPENYRGYLDDIRAQASRLSLLLSDVLDVAAMDQGRPVLDQAPFDLIRAVEASAATARQAASEKGLSFDLHLIAPRPAARLGDAARVAAIVRALMSNAVKFTSEGKVTVQLDLSASDRITLCVQDTGIGMTEAEQAAAVLPFVQNDDGIARRFEGAGLGLSIVTWLTEAMGGNFALSSTPGQGTLIRVSLPLPEVTQTMTQETVRKSDGPAPQTDATAAHGSKTETTTASAPPPVTQGLPAGTDAGMALEGCKVLVADDNQTNLKILQAMLGRLGAEVTLCSDGTAALQVWLRKHFDLVLLDINMPGMAGTEVIQAIREQEQVNGSTPVPALAVTANARPDQVAQYMGVGFDGCVAKPFTKAQLADRITRLLVQAKN